MDWMWFAIGAVLLMIELFIGSFVVLCFGLGALAYSGVLFFLPQLSAGSFPIGLVIVSLSSLAAVIMARKQILKSQSQPIDLGFEHLQGQFVIHEGEASVFVQGSFWRIANEKEIAYLNLRDGDKVWVKQVENNQVDIIPL